MLPYALTQYPTHLHPKHMSLAQIHYVSNARLTTHHNAHHATHNFTNQSQENATQFVVMAS